MLVACSRITNILSCQCSEVHALGTIKQNTFIGEATGFKKKMCIPCSGNLFEKPHRQLQP